MYENLDKMHYLNMNTEVLCTNTDQVIQYSNKTIQDPYAGR